MKFNLKARMNIMAKFALVIMAMVALNACNEDDGQKVEPAEVAFVSLYQASPNAPELDIIVDNRLINSYAFDYTNYTGYLRFYTGERSLQFGPHNANNVVADTTINFEANKTYSVFTADNYNALKVLVLEDNSDAPAAGEAKVRFLNLSPDATALDLVTDGNPTPMFTDLGFMEASPFTAVTAGSHDFAVKSQDNGEINLDVPGITFQEGWYYTVIVRGYDTPPTGNNNVLSAEVLIN